VSLEKVLKFGISKNYFKKLPIKDIDKSCCNLEYKIVDFDKTKEIICKESNQATRKSCDGLCLNKSVDFIEFKSLNNFFDKEFKYKLKSNKKNLEESEIIKEKVKSFNFNKKIRDSLWLFDFILNHHEVKLNNQELESFYNDKIEKRYFIVKDNFQPLINLSMQFNILAGVENNQLKNRETMDITINKELSKITSIEKPKLIDCNELEKVLKDKNE
jgi:hypothetical protein